jgi:spoIIIJ-associated protein
MTDSPESLDRSAPDATDVAVSVDEDARPAATPGSVPVPSAPATPRATEGVARSIPQLEEEGEVAADYIEEFLDIADLDGDIDIDARNGRAYVSVDSQSDDLEPLSKPDVVAALQELTRLAVQQRTGVFSRLILDVGGSRDARQEELTGMVEDAISRLATGAASVEFAPMSSYERKVVHDLAAERGAISESTGEGRERRVVIRGA